MSDLNLPFLISAAISIFLAIAGILATVYAAHHGARATIRAAWIAKGQDEPESRNAPLRNEVLIYVGIVFLVFAVAIAAGLVIERVVGDSSSHGGAVTPTSTPAQASQSDPTASNLYVDIFGNRSVVHPGDRISLLATVRNDSTTTVSQLFFQVHLKGVDYREQTASYAGFNGDHHDPPIALPSKNGKEEWVSGASSFDNLGHGFAPGSGFVIQFSVRVDPHQVPGSSVEISAEAWEEWSNPHHQQHSTTAAVVDQSASIETQMCFDNTPSTSQAMPGSVITYTELVTNCGKTPLRRVALRTALPQQDDFLVDYVPDSGYYDIGEGRQRLKPQGVTKDFILPQVLLPGQRLEVSYQVRIRADVQVGTVLVNRTWFWSEERPTWQDKISRTRVIPPSTPEIA